jgi:hypothetical protein
VIQSTQSAAARSYDRRMVPLDSNPFGEDRTLARRARAVALKRRTPTAGTTRTERSRTERLARHAGTWAARSRLAASFLTVVFDLAERLTRPERELAAKLKQSNVVRTTWAMIVLAIFLGSIVLSLVTGEGSGPG